MIDSCLTLARPYAQAVFDFAYEHKMLEKWELMLLSAKNLLDSEVMVQLLSNIDCVDSDDLAEMLILIGNHCFDCFFQNFIQVVAEYKRLYLLSFIYEEFLVLCRKQVLNVKIEIVSANVLDSNQVKEIISVMERKLLCKVDAIFRLDRSIIGGFIIYFDDIVIDGSIKGKIRYLKNNVLEI